jgi:hypothetical protein
VEFPYYHDHQEQVDAEIAEAARYVEETRAQNPNPLTRPNVRHD